MGMSDAETPRRKEVAELLGCSLADVRGLVRRKTILLTDSNEKILADYNLVARNGAQSPDVKEAMAQEKLKLLRAQRETAEIDLAREKGLVVEQARVLAEIKKTLTRMKAMFDSAFVSELPAKQGGLPSDKIAEMNKERLQEIYQQLSKDT